MDLLLACRTSSDFKFLRGSSLDISYVNLYTYSYSIFGAAVFLVASCCMLAQAKLKKASDAGIYKSVPISHANIRFKVSVNCNFILVYATTDAATLIPFSN